MMSPSPAKELTFLARACQESAEDIHALRRGEPIAYNLDFGLLCPVVFQQPGKGSKDFLAPPVAATRRVLTNASAVPFQVVISGYTMLEVFDQLAHLRHRLNTARPELYSSVEGPELREQLMTSESLRATLREYTERGLDGLVRNPIEQMSKLLDSGAIRGIGDVVDASMIRRFADPAQFDRFFAEHRRMRIGGEQKRDVDDSEFHYRIDAVNSCLTLAMAESGVTPAYLVTPTPLNIRQCTVGDVSYARVDRTPLFVMNTLELTEKGILENETDYLEHMARRSLEYAALLRDDRPLRSAPFNQKLDISRHFYDVSQMLGRTEPVIPEEIERDVQEITEALKDPARMRERITSAVSDLEDGARRLQAQASTLDLGYVSEFDFSDDPVLARVWRQLGLASYGD